MGLDWLPNILKTYGEMFTGAKTKYVADEIINYFLLSWDIELQVAFAIVCLTILVNVSLLFAIVITGNVKKSHSSLEEIRGLAESLILLSTTVEASKNMYNTTDPIQCFVAFWFFFAGSVNLGLIKSFTGFLRLSDKPTFSRLQWLIIMVMFAAFTLITFVVLCVLYMANILAFVIFICFLYFIPFVGMWIFDGLRFHQPCYKKKPKNGILEMEELTMAADYKTTTRVLRLQWTRQSEKPKNDRAEMEELAKAADNKTPIHVQKVQQTKESENPLSSVEVLCFLVYGFCHAVAFAVVTLVITRIAWIFVRPVFMEV